MKRHSTKTPPNRRDTGLGARPGKKARRFQRDMSDPLQDYRFEVGRPDEGERLDAFLGRRIRWRSRSQIKILIAEGRVEVVESRRHQSAADSTAAAVRPASRLRAGQEIVLWLDGPQAEDLEELEQAGGATGATGATGAAGADGDGERGVAPGRNEIRSVYDDAFLLAVDKPPGLSLYPTRRHRKSSLIELVHRRHRRREDSGSPPSPCHRLDRETSGVLLFARDVETRASVGEQIEARRVKKSYLAIVQQDPAGELIEDEGTIDLPLGRDPCSRVELKQAAVESGQAAVTRWRVRRRFSSSALVELHPETGRQHQLRAHLAAIGYPIVGDRLYLGGEEVFLRSVDDCLKDEDRSLLGHERQALHAWRLELTHPATGETLRIEAPLAPDLEDLLARLER